MSQPTIAAGFVASFLDFACRQGADRATLIAAASLDEAQLAKQDARIPVQAYLGLIQTAIALTGDSTLMLRQSLETELADVSIVGLILKASGGLRAGVAQLNRYSRLISDVETPGSPDRFALTDGPDGLWLYDHFPYADFAPQVIEETFGRMIAEFRRSAPDRRFGLALEVSYPAPDHAEAYAALLGVPTKFRAGRNALRIDPSWRDAPGPAPQAYLFGIFTDHADKLLAELSRPQSVRAQVEAQLLPDLHLGSQSMDRVARAMGMSRQTLYRRLQDEGVTFAEVLDGLRIRMARDYLAARRVTVNEAAYLLGFSEASSFVRAFKRWTGQTPSAFRDSLG